MTNAESVLVQPPGRDLTIFLRGHLVTENRVHEQVGRKLRHFVVTTSSADIEA